MTRLYNMYFSTKCNLKENLKNKRGQGMVEYVLIIAFIAIVVMVALGPLGTQIKVKFNEIVTALGGTPAQ
ncbi:MAG: Flp family type IVb pilin [Clostridia bacterium]|jgi:pilus assembly protein Flp/PilA|nr:Flp family type IVb pilin [Clostridia bacterium]